MSKTYQEFLAQKVHADDQFGFAPLSLCPMFFDFQSHLTEWSIRKGRSALLEDCGLGKTLQELCVAENWVKYTNKPVLILTPLAVAPQTIREGEKFSIPCKQTRYGKVYKGINVTNYERLDRYSPEDFAGLVCDEAGILKGFDSKTRFKVTEFAKKVRYCLLATATPAPNDYMELGNHSEALGAMGRHQMLGMFFSNCGETTQQWELKGHARTRFWQWVASWARALRKPSDLGFDDKGFDLPELKTERHIVDSVTNQEDGFGLLPAITLDEQRAERKATIRERCEKVAELVQGHDYSVVWCHLNTEGDLLEKLIPNAVQVQGSDKDEVKEERLTSFSNGEIPILITKPRIGGFGLNWQHCAHMTMFPSHCYDEATELLTKRGWLTFGEVTLEDKVATVKQDDLSFDWQHPTDVIWEPYCGDMVHFYSGKKFSRSFDLLVTPNHKMFVKKSNQEGYYLKMAGELEDSFKKQEYRMLSVPKSFCGRTVDSVVLPEYEDWPRISDRLLNSSGNRRGLNPSSWKEGLDKGRQVINIKNLPIDTFMRLAGWYLSEGYCGCRKGRYDGQITITQTEINPEHRAEIITMLNSIPGLNVYDKTKDIRCCSMQLALYLVNQFGAGSRNKRIPRWVKELDTPFLEILRDTMLKGDGCSSYRGGPKHCYRTVSKRLADDFSEICIKTGIRGSVKHRGIEGEYGDCWDVVMATKNTEPYIHIRPEIVQYAGMVGCVTVPNRTLIIRRNGISIVSGNSYEQYYQAVRRCWRFGQTRKVRVDIVTSQGEATVLDNMIRKEKACDLMFTRLIAEIDRFQKPNKNGELLETMELPKWLSNGRK